jgi:CBS domain-containing protein
VDDAMTREVVSLAPEQPFQEAITVLATRRFHHVLVADGNGRLRGVISDRDVLRFMVGRLRWESATVGDVMVPDPVAVRPESALSAACETMIAQRINCLPVVDADGRIAGILTSTDLLKALRRLQQGIEQDRRAA